MAAQACSRAVPSLLLPLRTRSFKLTLTHPPHLSLQRSNTTSARPAIMELKHADVYPFGVPSNDPAHATFLDLSWTIGNTDCWAVLSPSSSPTKSQLLDVVFSNARFSPTDSISHPILATLPLVPRPQSQGGPREPTIENIIQSVSFKTRLRHTGGAFSDYTARYFAIRDEDKLTTRKHLAQSMEEPRDGSTKDVVINDTAKMLQIDHLLDLPLVTLSNGQTRRARIVRALLAKPELLVLEEPFTGLDVSSRGILTDLLGSLHASQSPRIFFVLRPQDELPPFITHVALVGSKPGEVEMGHKDELLSGQKATALIAAGAEERKAMLERRKKRQERARTVETGKPIVELNQLNVTYEDRRVLLDIDWTIREGEKWVLAGHNGSGKSTLLSVILGDHPRSFMEDVVLFGKPRSSQATATIQQNIGHVSPEIFNAFPRRYGHSGLTAKEAIVTGFESVYSYRKVTPEQQKELDELLDELGHPSVTADFLNTLFAELSPGDQSLVLLLRALVKRPPLLVLDECFAFMSKETVDIVKTFIDEKVRPHQAVVLISHYEEELPDSVGRTLKLDKGRIVEKI